jgi:hypothetical protein
MRTPSTWAIFSFTLFKVSFASPNSICNRNDGIISNDGFFAFKQQLFPAMQQADDLRSQHQQYDDHNGKSYKQNRFAGKDQQAVDIFEKPKRSPMTRAQ